MRKLDSAVLLVCAVLCIGMPACGQQTGSKNVTQPVRRISADQAVDRVHDAVMKRHLTQLKEECVSYVDPVAQGADWIVDVREKHSSACGGDPATQPRLFSFAVNRTTGTLKTDALSPDRSRMVPLK